MPKAMPQRLLRPGINSSERVERLGDTVEVFYRRLMLIVDDFGRFEADYALIRSGCYPRNPDRVSLEQIGQFLTACEQAELIALYTVGRKRYLWFFNLGAPRAKHSIYPPPPENICSHVHAAANTREQTQTNAPLSNSVSVSGSYSSAGSYSGSGSGSAAAPTRPPLPALTAEEFAGPDVEQIAQQTASTLTKSHWFPSDLNLSRGFLATELAAAVNPIALAESIADSHRQWREQVEKARQSGSLPKTVENKALQWWLKDRYFDQKPKFGPISAETSKPKPKPASNAVVKLPPNGQALTREQVEAIRAGASVE